jgi:hypothetical protein
LTKYAAWRNAAAVAAAVKALQQELRQSPQLQPQLLGLHLMLLQQVLSAPLQPGSTAAEAELQSGLQLLLLLQQLLPCPHA